MTTFNSLAAANDVSDWVVNTDNYVKVYAIVLNTSSLVGGTLKLRTQAAVSGSDSVPTVADTTVQNPLNTELRVTIPPGYRFRFVLTAVASGAVAVMATEIRNIFSGVPQAFIKITDDATNHALVQTEYTALALVKTHLQADSAGNSVAQAITDVTTILSAFATGFGAS